MNGEYERVVLDLEPWLRGVLRKEDVSGYLKALGDDGLDEGEALDTGVAAEAGEKVVVKALAVARDIECGQRDPPDDPERYFKQVMRNALIDWFRTHPKAVGLSPGERAELDNGFLSIDKDEGDKGFGGWPTVGPPKPSAHPRSPTRPRLPFLLRLAQPPRNPNPAEYERVQELLNAIPNGSRREAVLLDLQGYRQEQIAAKVFKSQPAVSKALREQYAAWGWDDRRGEVQRIRYLTAYANLVRVFRRVFRNEGREFDPREDLMGSLDRVAEERHRTHERAFVLPQEEEAYRRSLPSGRMLRDQWSGSGPQPGSKERGQEKLKRLKAQEANLYKAIMNEPALAPRTKDLKPHHMQQLIAWMGRDDGDDDYDDDFLRL